MNVMTARARARTPRHRILMRTSTRGCAGRTEIVRRPKSAASAPGRLEKGEAIQLGVTSARRQIAQGPLLTRGAAATPDVILAVRQAAAHVAERPSRRTKRRSQHVKRVLV